MGMLPVVAVQVPWDIARCMLTVVHSNADIGMSGVVSCLCAVHAVLSLVAMQVARVIVSAMYVVVLVPWQYVGSVEWP